MIQLRWESFDGFGDDQQAMLHRAPDHPGIAEGFEG
jgi:hypothetical protein